MIAWTQSKINLGLRVLRRRSDGYHDIESVFYPVPLSDLLEMIPSADGRFRFSASGITVPAEAEDNLVVRACRLMEDVCRTGPLHVHLHKKVPAGSGLGGGSADAATCLKMINEIFSLNLDKSSLSELAGRLGSDCPFFIDPAPSLVRSRGEQLETISLDLKGFHLLLVFPGIQISTAAAYAGIEPAVPQELPGSVVSSPLETWKGRLVNDFERTVFREHPLLEAIRDSLYGLGAVYAAMTGSGSALYGLFEPGQEKKTAAASFPGCHHRILSL